MNNTHQIKVVAVVTPDGIQGSFTPEPKKPLIAHLEVHSNEIVFRDQQLKYDPNPPVQPEPYDPMVDDNFAMTEGVVDEQKEETEYQYKGIATRSFKRSFALGEYMEVTDAKFENGMLSITIERIIPEDKKPKSIKIK